MAERVVEIMQSLFKIDPIERTMIVCDHNHVRREEHFGQSALVHRKGAMPAERGSFGVVPGSMGTLSYHVEGRGHPESLMSSAMAPAVSSRDMPLANDLDEPIFAGRCRESGSIPG